MGLNCRIPTWCQRIIWCCGKNTHIRRAILGWSVSPKMNPLIANLNGINQAANVLEGAWQKGLRWSHHSMYKISHNPWVSGQHLLPQICLGTSFRVCWDRGVRVIWVQRWQRRLESTCFFQSVFSPLAQTHLPSWQLRVVSDTEVGFPGSNSAPPLTRCLTVDRLPNPSKPYFSPIKMEMKTESGL